ncbi:MAG: protease modulator HflC [Gammaproteobacteria bacterium]|nr:protease modulator HflC [Gammaproteobacteria bacterium]
MKVKVSSIAAIVFTAFLVFWLSTFTVDEREYAIRFQLSKIVKADYKPGLHFKWPFIESARKFDKRIQTVDLPPEKFLTAEKKNVEVDAFVKWRIVDITKFYKATGRGSMTMANDRLSRTIVDALKGQFGLRAIQEVISGDRTEIMNVVRKNVDIEAQKLGIEIVDVRLKRVDFSREVSQSVYDRMIKEREAAAQDFRSRGDEEARKLRARSEREREEILSKAYSEAEIIRGEGDAQAAQIYAKAYGRNPEFYAFHRSLQAYRNALGKEGDMLILDPNSDFFRYLKDSAGKR